MKLLTTIKFTNNEHNQLSDFINQFCWGDEVEYIKVKWINKASRMISIQPLDCDKEVCGETINHWL